MNNVYTGVQESKLLRITKNMVSYVTVTNMQNSKYIATLLDCGKRNTKNILSLLPHLFFLEICQKQFHLPIKLGHEGKEEIPSDWGEPIG